MTIEERLEKARLYRKQGYNCAQCMIVAFSDITGMTEEEALRGCVGLGGGCGCGELCGVLASMALMEGLRTDGSPMAKKAVYRNMKVLRDMFAERFGALRCEDLKSPERKVPCNDLIWAGVEMYDNHLRQS